MPQHFLRCTARIDQAQTVLRAMLDHLHEHELSATEHGGSWLMDYDGARITFRCEPDILYAELVAPSPEILYDARMLVHHHLMEFAECAPEDLLWDGDSLPFERPPAFRLLTVDRVIDLTPHLRRVRLRGSDLARYQSEEDIHCKLIFPQPDIADPEWPTLAADGTPCFPEGEKRLDIRTYTIRRIDASQGWMEVDFVLHDDAGPGCSWAARAAVGDQIGISGPGGRTAKPAAWMLLAGDETALPAIARILEGLPAGTRGTVLIEVQSAADEVPLTLPPSMTLQWLHRGEAPAGTTSLLADAIRAADIPSGSASRYAWVAAEFTTAQIVRSWLRETVGLNNKEQLVVAYWRRGVDETDMKSGKRQQKDRAPVGASS